VYRELEGLVSPPRDHILSGVSLGVIEELAAQLNMPFAMRPLKVAELQTADEAMLTSTSVCVLPIVECDGRPIGGGLPGPTYARLLAAWCELVGLDVAEQARRFSGRASGGENAPPNVGVGDASPRAR
jgi:branched-subunit amino acid aminotransferase/4-amino-4-deoxychorismate lyase